jgi:MFS transporter, DHA2 family, methylenomycin A resistance protein
VGVVDGYAIALASLMLAGGTVGDLHGHKHIVLVGLAVFGVASLACGAAPSSGLLVGARVLQGIGAALLLPGTLAIISHAFPEPDEQARAIGIWAGIGSLALPAGPLLGGALVDTFGWRAIFLINVPIVVVTLLVAARVVRESVEPQQRRLDLAGTALAAGTLAAVTFAFVEAGRGGVGSPVLAAAAVAVICFTGFVAVERSREHPMFPLGLFRRPDFSAANAAAGAMNLGTLGMLFVLTLYLQTVQHRSALAAGVAVLPLFLPLTVLAPLAGRLTARVGPKLPMAAGLLIAALGVGLLARAHADSGYRTLLPALLLWGIGMGILTPAVVAAAVRTVPARRAGLASAVNNTARQAGGAIGIAAFGAVAGSAAQATTFVAGLHTVDGTGGPGWADDHRDDPGRPADGAAVAAAPPGGLAAAGPGAVGGGRRRRKRLRHLRRRPDHRRLQRPPARRDRPEHPNRRAADGGRPDHAADPGVAVAPTPATTVRHGFPALAAQRRHSIGWSSKTRRPSAASTGWSRSTPSTTRMNQTPSGMPRA